MIRGQPRNGPPPERTLALAEIEAPRMARRPTATASATRDEPLAWESREFLRKLLVGKTVWGCVHNKVSVFTSVNVDATNSQTKRHVGLPPDRSRAGGSTAPS